MAPAAGGAARLSRATALGPLTLGALLSFAAGYVHLAYVESHWQEWWAYGAFFLASGLGQLIFAPVLLRWPSRPVLFAGLVANLGIVALYFLSRTSGPPAGPHVGVTEPAGVVDLTCTAAEVALVIVLLGLIGAPAARRIVNALLLAALLAWVLRLTGQLA